MRTVIRNGTVVNADGRVEADVVIEGSLIVEVVSPGRENVNADVEIDATGMYVIPGGVDPHVHLELDTGTTVSSDSFATGTIAAAHGGTTTIIDFAEQRLGGSVARSFADRMAQADGNCAIDWSLHQVIPATCCKKAFPRSSCSLLTRVGFIAMMARYFALCKCVPTPE
jgi:dihydropyrimidinase